MAEAFVSFQDNKSLVSGVEIHFLFPFSCPKWEEFEPQNPAVWEAFPHAEDPCGRLFGDDGHLEFHGHVKTFELNDPSAKQEKFRSTIKEEVYEYEMNQVFIRLFHFGIGVLRFALTARSSVSIQSVLNVQNGVMRLKNPKSAGRLRRFDGYNQDCGDFLPERFIEQCLGDESEGKYSRDRKTDRLFVFTLASIAGLNDQTSMKVAAYKIATMEWTAERDVGARVVDTFYEQNVFKKFVLNDRGLWSCFHRDAGSILVFEKSTEELAGAPFWNYARMKQGHMDIYGSSWPFVALSLAEPVVFQRTFLRRLDEDLRRRLKRTGVDSDRANVKEIKKLHAKLLRFRADYYGTPISTTTGGSKHFEIWSGLCGITELRTELAEFVQNLDDYYENVQQSSNQFRLDVLTVVLGFLGVAELLNGIYWGYRSQLKLEASQRDPYNAIVPSLISGVVIIVAIIVIVLLKIR